MLPPQLPRNTAASFSGTGDERITTNNPRLQLDVLLFVNDVTLIVLDLVGPIGLGYRQQSGGPFRRTTTLGRLRLYRHVVAYRVSAGPVGPANHS